MERDSVPLRSVTVSPSRSRAHEATGGSQPIEWWLYREVLGLIINELQLNRNNDCKVDLMRPVRRAQLSASRMSKVGVPG